MLKSLNEERRDLAAKSVKYADRVAERWERAFPEHVGDLKSSATWGGMRAASTYEEESGQAWDRWLKMCVQGSVKNFLGSRQTRELNKTESIDNVDEIPVTDEDWYERNDALDALLARLTRRQRELCELIYRYGMSSADASKELGMTPKLGWKIHNAALDRLRKSMAA